MLTHVWSCQWIESEWAPCRNRSARKACQPICALNPYNNDWTIRAKVASKTPLRCFEKNGQTNSVGTLEVVDDQVRDSQTPVTQPVFWGPEAALRRILKRLKCTTFTWSMRHEFAVCLPAGSLCQHTGAQAAAAKHMDCMQGTTIEITLWRGVADKFYDHIEEGQVRRDPCQLPLMMVMVMVTGNLRAGDTSVQGDASICSNCCCGTGF